MENEVHIRSKELCDRCKYGRCGQVCLLRQPCELDTGVLCRCDEVQPGTPCPYFTEVQEE